MTHATAITSFPKSGTISIGGIDFRYDLRAEHVLLESGRHRIRGWIISPHHPEKEVSMIVSFNGAKITRAAHVERPDVLKHFAILEKNHLNKCGFNFEFLVDGAASDSYEISLRANGAETILGEISANKVPFIVGDRGWLFLDGDSNRSTQQYTGSFNIDTAWDSGWSKYFSQLSLLQREYKTAFIVAPAKEEIFQEYYPYARGSKTFIDHLYARFSSTKGVLDLRPAIREIREYCYDRGETHWSDFAGDLASEQCCRAFGCSYTRNASYTLKISGGDLYDKSSITATNFRIYETFEPLKYCIYNNGIIHHGNSQIFHNPDAPKRTVMLLGGSSGEQMIPGLIRNFEHVIYHFTAGSIDLEEINTAKPDLLILQTNQRFLPTPPDSSFSLQEKINKKREIGAISQDRVITNGKENGAV